MTKLIKRIIAGTLAFACFATAGVSAIVTNGFGAFAPQDTTQAVVPQAPIENGGMKMGDVVETSGMKLQVVKAAAYNSGGAATAAEESYQLTATVLPADAADKTVTYTAAWSNANSTWATGKNVNDYVTVAQGTAGSLTATVTCKQVFGEPIVVTVTSNDNPDAKASATLHYKQKITSYSLYDGEGNGFITTGESFTKYESGQDKLDITMYVDFDNDSFSESYLEANIGSSSFYTRECNFDVSLNMTPTEEFKNVLSSLNAPVSLNVDEDGAIRASDLPTKVWFEEYGTTNEKKNQIINALIEFEGVAYIATLTDGEGGTVTFNISLDTSALSGQKRVESVTLNNVELEF